MPHRWTALLLTATILLGFSLRLYRLNHQSVWHDEAISMLIAAESLSFITTTAIAVVPDSNPPLYNYLLHGFFRAFGYGVLQARFFSLLFGVLAILVVYFLGEAIFDSATGLVAAFLLAISELGIMYSQEARNYELALLLIMTAGWLIVRALSGQDKLAWYGFISVTVLIAYTHYYASFGPAAMILFAVLRRRKYPIPGRWWIIGGVLLVLLYLPWIFLGLPGALAFRFFAPTAQISSISVKWSSFPSALNWFNNGRMSGINSSSQWWVYGVGLFLFTLPAIYGWKRAREHRPERMFALGRRDGVLFLTLLVVLPMLAVLAAAARSGIYNVRHVSFYVGPYYVLVAHGLVCLRPALRAAVLSLVVVYSLAALRSVYFIPYKENNRDALAYFAGHYQSGDCTIFLPGTRYFGRLMYWGVYYRDVPEPPLTTFDQLNGNPGACSRVWVVRDLTWWLDLERQQSDAENLRGFEETHAVADKHGYYRAEVTLYVQARKNWRFGTKP